MYLKYTMVLSKIIYFIYSRMAVDPNNYPKEFEVQLMYMTLELCSEYETIALILMEPVSVFGFCLGVARLRWEMSHGCETQF